MDDEMREFMRTINTKLDDILGRLARSRENIDRITKLEDEIRRERRAA